jgi:hypothetical protein
VRPNLEKTFHQKKGTGGVAQGIGPEFKSQYCKKKRKKIQTYFLDVINKKG